MQTASSLTLPSLLCKQSLSLSFPHSLPLSASTHQFTVFLQPCYLFQVLCMCLRVFWDRILLCSPGYLGTQYIDQAGLGLTEICLPLPPKYQGVTGVHHHSQLVFLFLRESQISGRNRGFREKQRWPGRLRQKASEYKGCSELHVETLPHKSQPQGVA